MFLWILISNPMCQLWRENSTKSFCALLQKAFCKRKIFNELKILFSRHLGFAIKLFNKFADKSVLYNLLRNLHIVKLFLNKSPTPFDNKLLPIIIKCYINKLQPRQSNLLSFLCSSSIALIIFIFFPPLFLFIN